VKEPAENINQDMEITREERSLQRRKRRIRNQIIAYVTAVILLAGIVGGANVGVQSLLDFLRSYQAAKANASEPVINIKEEEATADEATVNTKPPEEEIAAVPEPEPEPEPTAEISVLDLIVENCLAELSLEEKIAALFILTPELLTGADNVTRAGDMTREKLLAYPVGGLVYFGTNIQSASQITEMLENTRNMSKYPLFLAVDEEGGRVARLAAKNLAANVGPMRDIGETLDPQNAKEAGEAIAAYLSEFGFNVNFAPVADVDFGLENSPIGDRSFGDDPVAAAEMVKAFVLGTKQAGVHSTLKHFPGIGSTVTDTHVSMAVTERTLEELHGFEFLPFIAGIEAGADLIMVSHVSAPNVTDDNTPASLSKKMITEILRGELGYDGIVITDAMNMGAITEYYTAADASVRALQAGADMILMPESFEEAYIGITEAVQSGKITEERINESLRRIYRVKYAAQAE
jgi:beta-N-acetylhexosaminidase